MNNTLNEVKTNTETPILLPIKEIINRESHISDALKVMFKYRSWSKSTCQSYKNDVEQFEHFLMKQQLDPLLKHGEGLHLVQAWIKEQQKENVAYKTICRRIASLSSIYSFYMKLRIVEVNGFEPAQVTGSKVGQLSSFMELDDMKKVYKVIQSLKEEGIDVEIPVKLLLFTGLRSQAYTTLKVESIKWEESVLLYDSGIDNSKHKVQILPLPPKLLATLKEFVEVNQLEQNDPLCYGLKRMPLANKQLNRITNTVCERLGWTGENKVTPHGFRYSISTLLDERGISRENIKYLLGHSDKENIASYLKNSKRKIFQLKTALTEIEQELEAALHQTSDKQAVNNPNELVGESGATVLQSNGNLDLSADALVQLCNTSPDLLKTLMLALGIANKKTTAS